MRFYHWFFSHHLSPWHRRALVRVLSVSRSSFISFFYFFFHLSYSSLNLLSFLKSHSRVCVCDDRFCQFRIVTDLDACVAHVNFRACRRVAKASLFSACEPVWRLLACAVCVSSRYAYEWLVPGNIAINGFSLWFSCVCLVDEICFVLYQ